MKDTFIKRMGCLVILSVIMIPISVAANRYLCSSTEWDFGDAAIGSSSIVIFTLSNVDGAVIVIRNILIVNDISDSFKILIDVPPPPIFIPIDAAYDIIVEFSPSSLGSHSAELRIISNANNSDVFIPVQGVGVPTESPPGEYMADLIDSFNKFVKNKTIKPSGPVCSARCRLKTFGNMLKASSDLINAHDFESACVQLRDTLRRIDGDMLPPDFMEGLKAETLATKIRGVINQLECP